jgi:uncharacterized protein (UPF0248 family)
MKTIRFTIMINVFLLFLPNGAQAQSTEIKLDQVELMKQFIGNWKVELGEDTAYIAEIAFFGNGGLEEYNKVVIKGKDLAEKRCLWGYDKKYDKYVIAIINKNDPNINFMAIWFTSKTLCEYFDFVYISNPEVAPSKETFEFKSPDLFIETDIKNNQPFMTYTYSRIKK